MNFVDRLHSLNYYKNILDLLTINHINFFLTEWSLVSCIQLSAHTKPLKQKILDFM